VNRFRSLVERAYGELDEEHFIHWVSLGLERLSGETGMPEISLDELKTSLQLEKEWQERQGG